MADKELAPLQVPSTRRLAAASAIALAVALVVLVTTVLPAEYGIDPLGTGKALGLVALTEADTPVAAPPVATDAGLIPTALAHGGAYYPAEYTYDVRRITLQPYDYVEYKYHLGEGAQMLFSWAASAPVMQEFHGEPDDGPEGYFESFDKGTRQRADGSLIAPFTGIHGWYWENPGAEAVTIRIMTAGFYSAALEIGSNKKRQPRELKALDTLPSGEN